MSQEVSPTNTSPSTTPEMPTETTQTTTSEPTIKAETPATILEPIQPITSQPPSDPIATTSSNDEKSLEPPQVSSESQQPRPTSPQVPKNKNKLVLSPPVPDDQVSECTHCKRSFSLLMLRFKHHCKVCGNVFCGSCTKMTAVRAPDMPPEILMCIPCNEAEAKRQEKEIKRQQKRDALKLEQDHLAELFVELQRAFEANDEAKAVLVKSEIDRIKEIVNKREQAKQAKKEEKQKVKDEKKAAKVKVKSPKPAKASSSTPSTSTTTSAKSKPVVPKKPLDTPETIAAKLEERYGLEPSKLITPPYDSSRKCLVLDIDYTLFDHKWQPQVKSEHRSDKSMIPLFKRPYLHEFLETCNSKFDIIIWSATGMPAIDNKVGNLGIYSNTRYKLTAVFCKDHMIHVTKPRKGGRTFDETVKPLSVIWKRFPEFYNPKNTIHIDDMVSNFQLNPGNGIHILPYKESSTHPGDTELLYLTKYLMMIADTEPDFSLLPHRKWKEWLIDRLWAGQAVYSIPAHVPDAPIDKKFLLEPELPKSAKKAAAAAARPSTPAAGSVESTTSSILSLSVSVAPPLNSASALNMTPSPMPSPTSIPNRQLSPFGTPRLAPSPPLSPSASSISIPSPSTTSTNSTQTLGASQPDPGAPAFISPLTSPSPPRSTLHSPTSPTSPQVAQNASSSSSSSPLSIDTKSISPTASVGSGPNTPVGTPEVRSWVRSAFPRPQSPATPSQTPP